MYTELEILNSVLAGAGYAPVASADQQNPAVRAAMTKINEARHLLMQRKWWFNHYDVTLTPDLDEHILLPQDCVSVIVSGSAFRNAVTQRGRYLFDLKNNTDRFTDAVQARVTINLSTSNLPSIAQEVVRTHARWKYYIDKGGTQKEPDMRNEYSSALAFLNQEHLMQSKTNWLDSPMGAHKATNPFPNNWRQE